MTSLLKNIDGVTGIEYGLLAAGISIAILAVVFAIGGDINTMFTSISTMLSSNL